MFEGIQNINSNNHPENQHSDEAREMLKNYYIGDLIDKK